MFAQHRPRDETGFGKSKVQRRRRMRACDMCRRRKVRCDGDNMPEDRCSNCRSFDYECTYVEGSTKRYGNASYVQGLENELASLRALFEKLHPDIEHPEAMSRSLATPTGTRKSVMPEGNATRSPGAARVPQIVDGDEEDDIGSSDDEIVAAHTSLTESLQNIMISVRSASEVPPDHSHFFGKSSSFTLVQTAMEMKHEYTMKEAPEGPRNHVFSHRRPEFWHPYPWQCESIEYGNAPISFPEPDLMSELISIYFTKMNLYTPLLHQPTFVQRVQEGLHLNNEGFATTLLLVCALGARLSNDPRVLLEGIDTWHSAGWKWFKQVQIARKAFKLTLPQTYDLQIICLAAMYLGSSSAPGSTWTLVGTGLRMAQDMGAHRRKMYSETPTVEGELRKRAFWVLITMDRMMCSMLGRPCSIHDEDFDVDLPIECDDEYWVHPDPAKAFTQPPGKPSTITFFNCTLRLARLNAFVLRTLYSTNKSKTLFGFRGPKWEQQIVSEIDSELNKWVDAVPVHLRWDPTRENPIFMSQSTLLYSAYYALQIMVHRPFIPSSRKASPVSFPSLAICTNAARSAIHVLDRYYERVGVPYYHWHHSLFVSGIVLLLNIWGAKRSGSSVPVDKEMGEVHKAMTMLKALEPRWHSAGRLWDILYDLATVGDLPLPQPAASNHKRPRDYDNAAPIPSSSAGQINPGEHRNMAGTKRVHKYQQISPSPDSQDVNASFHAATGQLNLPIHSDELGRLPLHRIFDDFSSSGDLSDYSWSSPGSGPSVAPMTPEGQLAATLDLNHPPLSIFSEGTAQELYEQLFRPSGHLESSLDVQQPVNPQTYEQAPLTNDGCNHTAPPETLVDDGGQFFPQLFDSDTLDIWSNAPTNFEWDDWGTYVTNITR